VHAAPPQNAPAIVRLLHRDEQRLQTALASWDGNGSVPSVVTAAAQERQWLIRVAARDASTAADVIRLAPAERDDLRARRDLLALANRTPPLKEKIRLGRAPPPAKLLQWYREAQRRFGVRWQLLAAINFVESAFGKVRNTSVAGAEGPMQFEPATWRAYGLGGDVHDPHDAILGAANYLRMSGARRDERHALFHYNPSWLYVDAVLRYAHRIAAKRYAFYEYYAWRVYIRGPSRMSSASRKARSSDWRAFRRGSSNVS
jgi:membrane-bound lytic murein transglycosylase B